MIKIVDLHKSFGKQKVLKGVNLEIHKGEITAIIGRSGSGKTVLVKHIVGLLKPNKGHIFVDGTDITRAGAKELKKVRRRFGMLFQEAALFDFMTVGENIAFPLREHTKLSEREINQIVKEKLKLVGLPNIENKMPSELSGGMKKRVGLARAIVLEPEILIYDEPTTGLDPVTSASIYELILEMESRLKITSIIISHDVPTIFAVADKVAVLSQGQIAICDESQKVFQSDNPEIQNFLTAQIKRFHGKLSQFWTQGISG